MDYQTLRQDLVDIKNVIGNMKNKQYLDIILKHYKYPNEINELIKEDTQMTIDILDYIYQDIIIKFRILSFEEIIEENDYIQNNKHEKSNPMRFRNIIYVWLKNNNFFNYFSKIIEKTTGNEEINKEVKRQFKKIKGELKKEVQELKEEIQELKEEIQELKNSI